jgi:hypothetical protein
MGQFEDLFGQSAGIIRAFTVKATYPELEADKIDRLPQRAQKGAQRN